MRRAVSISAVLAVVLPLALGGCDTLQGVFDQSGIVAATPESVSVRHHAIAEAHAMATSYCKAAGKSPSYMQSSGDYGFGWPVYAWRDYRYECVVLPATASTPDALLAGADARHYLGKFQACLDQGYAATLKAAAQADEVEPLLRERCLIHVAPVETAMAAVGGTEALQKVVTAAIGDTTRRYREVMTAATPK